MPEDPGHSLYLCVLGWGWGSVESLLVHLTHVVSSSMILYSQNSEDGLAQKSSFIPMGHLDKIV